jgi:hypothetical protein
MKTSKNKFATSHKQIVRKETHRLRNNISGPTGNDGRLFDRGILTSDVFQWRNSLNEHSSELQRDGPDS